VAERLCQTALLFVRLFFGVRVVEIISTVYQLDVIRHTPARKRLVMIASGITTSSSSISSSTLTSNPSTRGGWLQTIETTKAERGVTGQAGAVRVKWHLAEVNMSTRCWRADELKDGGRETGACWARTVQKHRNGNAREKSE
jgi:hypothetical protein